MMRKSTVPYSLAPLLVALFLAAPASAQVAASGGVAPNARDVLRLRKLVWQVLKP